MTKYTTLSFDDIDTGQVGITAVPNGYGGLNWSNFYALDVSHNPAYAPGATSGQQVALDGGGAAADVTLSGGSFTLKSVEMTAAYDKRLVVDIYGYKDGTEVFHKTVNLNDTAPKLVNLNFKGVDDVAFVPGDGRQDPHRSGSGSEFALDDMVVGKVTPAPEVSATAPMDHGFAALASWHLPAGQAIF